jgi:hypothetical protein
VDLAVQFQFFDFSLLRRQERKDLRSKNGSKNNGRWFGRIVRIPEAKVVFGAVGAQAWRRPTGRIQREIERCPDEPARDIFGVNHVHDLLNPRALFFRRDGIGAVAEFL